VFVDNGHEAVLAAFRRDLTGKEGAVLLIANLDIYHPQTVTITLPRDGLSFPVSVKEALTGEVQTFLEPTFPFTLGPCGVKVFQFPFSGA
jgi:hypothetical protein